MDIEAKGRILPKLYADPSEIELKAGQKLVPVKIEIAPDGSYSGDQFEPVNQRSFKMRGFDRTDGREVWQGEGLIVEETRPRKGPY